MILFINKVKIKWKWDTCIERKILKKYKSQFPANKISSEEIEKKTIFFLKKKEIDLRLSEPACQIYNLIVTPE